MFEAVGAFPLAARCARGVGGGQEQLGRVFFFERTDSFPVIKCPATFKIFIFMHIQNKRRNADHSGNLDELANDMTHEGFADALPLNIPVDGDPRQFDHRNRISVSRPDKRPGSLQID